MHTKRLFTLSVLAAALAASNVLGQGTLLKQALGVPNTMTYGDNSSARASAVVVRETFGNGFVQKIFAIDAQGTPHQVWVGKDATQPNDTVNFIAEFPKTTYLVKAVKVVTDPDHDMNAYEEIDAIGLHGYGYPQ